MTKVSVIIPTWCSGEGLDRVMASLDAQSMPPGEFEIVCVDDGSPDDTADRLRMFAKARPHMQVHVIENSGWPSRPRNIGIEAATGEYVTFMDHDDALFPDALRDAYACAVEHDADVVNLKESTTHGWFWGFASFQHDAVASGATDPTLLMPMRPHKLYRRDLLLRHGIRFREGRRMIYEDIYFNLDVLPYADRVAVLASRPFYRWVNTGENNSGSYGKDADEAWGAFDAIFEQIVQLDLEPQVRDALLLHTYKLRVLMMMLGPRLSLSDEEWQRRSLELAPGVADRYVPVAFDDRLDPANRARALLLRTGRTDLLPRLADADRGLKAELLADAVTWTASGALSIEGRATWRTREGDPFPVRRTPEGLFRRLPEDLEQALPPEVLRLDEALADTAATVTVKSREDSSDWAIPTEHALEVGDTVDVRVAGSADPARVVFGRALPAGRWDVGCRFAFAGFVAHTAVRYDGPATVALLDGRVVVAAPSRKGRLSVEVDAPVAALLEATKPLVAAATPQRSGVRRTRLTVPVSGVDAARDSRVPVTVRLRPTSGGAAETSVEGHLVGDAEGVRLEVTLALPRGEHRLLVTAADGSGPTWWTPVVVARGRLGRAVVRRRPVRGRRRRVWGRPPRQG